MTRNHEAHLDKLKKACLTLMDSKYRKGQKEHGGDLWRMPLEDLLDNAILEAVDQVVYLLTARERLNDMRNEGG